MPWLSYEDFLKRDRTTELQQPTYRLRDDIVPALAVLMTITVFFGDVGWKIHQQSVAQTRKLNAPFDPAEFDTYFAETPAPSTPASSPEPLPNEPLPTLPPPLRLTLAQKRAEAVFWQTNRKKISELGRNILAAYNDPRGFKHTSSVTRQDGSRVLKIAVDNSAGREFMDVTVKPGAAVPTAADVTGITIGMARGRYDTYIFQASLSAGTSLEGTDAQDQEWFEAMYPITAATEAAKRARCGLSIPTEHQLNIVYSDAARSAAGINRGALPTPHQPPLAATCITQYN
jgi:hypothetical protein